MIGHAFGFRQGMQTQFLQLAAHARKCDFNVTFGRFKIGLGQVIINRQRPDPFGQSTRGFPGANSRPVEIGLKERQFAFWGLLHGCSGINGHNTRSFQPVQNIVLCGSRHVQIKPVQGRLGRQVIRHGNAFTRDRDKNQRSAAFSQSFGQIRKESNRFIRKRVVHPNIEVQAKENTILALNARHGFMRLQTSTAVLGFGE